MVSIEEESFPRGRRKVEKQVKRSAPTDDNLFATVKAPKAKKAKRSNKKEVVDDITEEDGFQSKIRVTGSLSYKTVQEDMVLLAAVRQIKNFSLDLELPGLIFGQVTITNISDQFTQYINEQLKEGSDDVDADFLLKNVFHVGQYVVAKVIQIEKTDRGCKVHCSLNPNDINRGRSINSFKKDMLVWGCIQSVLDHGYEVSLGVKNCRVFLPQEQVETDKKYTLGEPLWCIVHKHVDNTIASTLRVSAKSANLLKNTIDEESTLSDLVPGTQVDFITEKIVDSGIQGKFQDTFFGYINESFLKTPLQKVQHYAEGKLLKAYVLYVEPATKIAHLSLRALQETDRVYKYGEVVNGEVFCKTVQGLCLQLPAKLKAFVSNKRLLNTLPKSLKTDLKSAISSKYPIGSKHNCSILDYNYLTQTYIVSMEQSVVKQGKLKVHDLKCGQLLNVSISEIKPEGLAVQSGAVRGFVPNFHVCNAQFSENMKKRYTVGKKANARVLKITEDGNVLFTLKQGLVNSEQCLSDMKDALPKLGFPGVVILTKPNYAVVSFYGDVVGTIGKRNLDGKDGSNVKMNEYFNRGQVVNTWIQSVTNNKIQLSLKEPNTLANPPQTKIKVGDITSGIVTSIAKNQINVQTANGRTFGYIPTNHISPVSNLCNQLLQTFKVGEKINDLMCIDNSVNPVLLSRREGIRSQHTKNVKEFGQLRAGMVVRCFVHSVASGAINVTILTKDYHEQVRVPVENLLLQKFEKHQVIVATIKKLDQDTKAVQLSTKVAPNVDYAIQLFADELEDLDRLRQFGSEQNWPHCEYNSGQKIEGVVTKTSNAGCALQLPNNCMALVPQPLINKNIKVDQSIAGAILVEDFVTKTYTMCLDKHINELISDNQDGNTNFQQKSACTVRKLLQADRYILGVLAQKDGNGQLVYIPLHLNESSVGSTASYYSKAKFKVSICGKVNNCLIGLSTKLFVSVDKTSKKAELEMAKRKVKIDVGKCIEARNSDDEHMEYSDNDNDLEQDNLEESDNENDGEPSKLEQESGIESDEDQDKPTIDKKAILPGISSFFTSNKPQSEDSSSDEDEQEEVVKKKKKLSRAERAEEQRLEEARISQIEQKFADNTTQPENADDFDRLVTANPNSAELWTRYMAFHIASTEIDKARTVARKALESIGMTLVQERLNIWIALLHLENAYGSKESFDQTFNDAVKCNDSLQVYLKVIEMLADIGKIGEMEEKIRKVRNKHKQAPEMWLECAKVYYKLNKFKDARNMKDSALKSILDKKTQMSIIVRFAIMEFRDGEEEHGSAIFESILNADPRKVTIWSTYVDQLVKNGKIDEARKVLERSIVQKLPLKSMRSLFLKFRKFEEEHGNAGTVQNVKEKAAEYMAKVSK